jgi:GMP synthase (glutamine-hydrolysing)
MDPPADTCRLLYMHQDQVVAIPEDAVVIARTDHCPVAMLRVGRTMLGVQAHPEFRATYIRALLDTRAERIGEDETDAARRSLDAPTDADRMGKWLLRFMEEAA